MLNRHLQLEGVLFRLFIFFVVSMLTHLSVARAQPRWVRDVIDTTATTSVDREASTLILYKAFTVEFSKRGKVTIHGQTVTKVLQRSGAELVDLVELVSDGREMNNLDGWLVKTDGNVVDLADEDIIQVSTSGTAGEYHDNRTLRAAFPNVKPGDIVAYDYEIRDEESSSSFVRLTMQHQQPVKNVRLNVTVPEGWSLRASTWRMEPFRSERGTNRFTWIATDLPFEPDEPLMPSLDYLSREIHLVAHTLDPTEKTTWGAVADWWTAKLENGVIIDPDVTETTRNLTAALGRKSDQIRAVARFVSTDIRYVAVELGEGRWEPRAAPATLRNRYGDCKDKTTLMRAMLRSINIPSSAVLLNTRIAIDSSLPTPFLFNHCIIGIPAQFARDTTDILGSSMEDWLLYDPTDMNTAFGSITPALQGNNVLVVHDSSSTLLRIPKVNPESSTIRFRGSFKLNRDASMSGRIIATHVGMAANDERYAHRTMDRQKLIDSWNIMVQQTIKYAEISSFQWTDSGDSIQTSFEVSARDYLTLTGNGYLLRLNPFSTIDVSPLTKETRRHPIWFGAPGIMDVAAAWMLPKEWKTEIDAPLIRSSCPAAAVVCAVSFTDSTIAYGSTNRRTGDVLPVEQYALAKKYRSDLSTSRNMTLFVRKP